MSLGTLSVAMPKPIEEMSVAELRRERDYWDAYARNPMHQGAVVGCARNLRDALNLVIARREGI